MITSHELLLTGGRADLLLSLPRDATVCDRAAKRPKHRERKREREGERGREESGAETEGLMLHLTMESCVLSPVSTSSHLQLPEEILPYEHEARPIYDFYPYLGTEPEPPAGSGWDFPGVHGAAVDLEAPQGNQLMELHSDSYRFTDLEVFHPPGEPSMAGLLPVLPAQVSMDTI
ncbi:hypothetical protein DNTS_011892 [Danionella cerebrum]|uniref:Uncharacterized protein n=1 Tax=Danionella cerebrum TaxID=2873325 RepID=A0A553Q7G0_9TELE|nr:hypothetical protein DNTS_011892 [Danionella translucida]